MATPERWRSVQVSWSHLPMGLVGLILPVCGLAGVAVIAVLAPPAWQPIANLSFQAYIVIVLIWALWRLSRLLWLNRVLFRTRLRGRSRRAWEIYVRALFDGYAETYDQHLRGRLAYVGPEALAGLLSGRIPPDGELDIADLGCGTGLCGPVLRPYARWLIGVDLSKDMLAQAKLTGCYDQLENANLLSFLIEHPRSFDGLAAIDVLPYFKNLDHVLAACLTALRPGGWLVVSTESDDVPQVKSNRMRFAHSQCEVRRSAERTGLHIERAKSAILRQEADRPMTADLYLLRRGKPGNSDQS